jgi:magnesium transporter
MEAPVRKDYRIADGKITEAHAPETGAIWLYIQPDEAEKKFLIDQCRIDEHTLNSSLDPDELSRLEIEPDHTAIIYKRPKNYSAKDKLIFKVASTGLFVFADKIVIVMDEEIPLFNIKQFQKVTTLCDVMLKLVYGSIFHYLEHLKIINYISDELEQKINLSFENKYLINLFAIEKSLVYYLNSINSNKALIDKLKLNAVKLGLSTVETEFLDDIFIENDQCFKQAEIYSNILAGMSDARASIVSNNLNILMKQLTVITIIFMPLNLLSGIGGMSEWSMMTSGLPWPVSYSMFVGILIIISLIMWFGIKRLENKGRG